MHATVLMSENLLKKFMFRIFNPIQNLRNIFFFNYFRFCINKTKSQNP